MINTLPINDFEEKTENIYEAVIILAKRSRQINNDQKPTFNQGDDFDEEYDEFNDDIPTAEMLDREYEKLPKPSSIALDEFFSGKIKYKYHEVEDEEETAKS